MRRPARRQKRKGSRLSPSGISVSQPVTELGSVSGPKLKTSMGTPWMSSQTNPANCRIVSKESSRKPPLK